MKHVSQRQQAGIEKVLAGEVTMNPKILLILSFRNAMARNISTIGEVRIERPT